MEKNELKPYEKLWVLLSGYLQQCINEGIDDEENGRVISSEEFWASLKKE